MEMIKMALALGLLFLFVGGVRGAEGVGNATKPFVGDDGIGEIPAEVLRENKLLHEWCVQADTNMIPQSLKTEEVCLATEKEECVIRNIHEQALKKALGKAYDAGKLSKRRVAVGDRLNRVDLCHFANNSTTSTTSTVSTTPGAGTVTVAPSNDPSGPPSTNATSPPSTNATSRPPSTNATSRPPSTNATSGPPSTNATSEPPSTNATSEPPSTNPGPITDSSELNVLYWVLPLVGVLLALLGLAGFCIHRYNKRAGYLASAKTPPGEHVKNEGSDV